MFLPTAVLAPGSVAIGILYPSWLKLGQAAPVQPSAVFSPFIEVPGQSTIIRINTLYLPSTLRAMGAAEAFDYHSRRSSVRIKYDNPPESNATYPQWRIDYSYHITATDFGLQKPLDLVHNVTGSCYAEYGWIHPSTVGAKGRLDEYWLWGNESSSFLVPGPEYPGPAALDFTGYPHPRTQDTDKNISFSFIAFTASVGSMTPSNDPWYLTQPLNGSHSSSTDEYGYQIKPGRPVLSCWQETLFCVGGVCDNVGLMKDIPAGIRLILASTHAMPMIMNIAVRAGVSSLKSYVGSASGQVIDAASSTMLADIERLVLASFLSSREVFRDTVLMSRPPGLANLLEDGEGKLYPGAEDFVVRTSDAVSVRFDLLLIAPVACAVIWIVVCFVHSPTRLHQMLDEGEWKPDSMPLITEKDISDGLAIVYSDGRGPAVNFVRCKVLPPQTKGNNTGSNNTEGNNAQVEHGSVHASGSERRASSQQAAAVSPGPGALGPERSEMSIQQV